MKPALLILTRKIISDKDDISSVILHGGKIGDDAYWDERDASIFAAKIPCPYLRIQHQIDHAQKTSKEHMMAIINAATRYSGQWTRCNDNPPNIIYEASTLSQYHFHEEPASEVNKILPRYIKEMFFQKPWKEGIQ